MKPLALCVCGTVLLWAGVYAVLRARHAAATVTTVLVVAFFGYGHLVEALGFLGGEMARTLARFGGLVPLAGGTLWLTRGLARDRRGTGVTMALNAAALLLILFPLSSITVRRLTRWTPRVSPVAGPVDAAIVPGPRPDIYFIVLDKFARSDVLRDLYGHDNAWFTNALRARGFHVVPDSRSNYSLTFLSLASALNMRYLDGEVESMRSTLVRRDPFNELIRQSAVQTFLRRRGYLLVHFASGWGVTDDNPGADIRLGLPILQELWSILFSQTLWGSLFPHGVDSGWRRLIFHNLDELGRIAARPGPKFVFAHFVCPHEPYVFFPDGSDPRKEFGKKEYQQGWNRHRRYLDNLEFISRRILIAIDRIRSESETPPVILLVSDHGSDALRLREDHPSARARERLGNLIALSLPGPTPARVPRTFTLVNVFRLVFDRYFGTSRGMLPNRSYYSDAARPYETKAYGFPNPDPEPLRSLQSLLQENRLRQRSSRDNGLDY